MRECLILSLGIYQEILSPGVIFPSLPAECVLKKKRSWGTWATWVTVLTGDMAVMGDMAGSGDMDDGIAWAPWVSWLIWHKDDIGDELTWLTRVTLVYMTGATGMPEVTGLRGFSLPIVKIGLLTLTLQTFPSLTLQTKPSLSLQVSSVTANIQSPVEESFIYAAPSSFPLNSASYSSSVIGFVFHKLSVLHSCLGTLLHSCLGTL